MSGLGPGPAAGTGRSATVAGAAAAGVGTTFAERVVARTSSLLGRGQSRRRFLAKAAVAGSALAVNPWGYIFRPGTAYAALCGTCSDGWTAFCCTINSGRNSCPPSSFVAGWWKADNAAFCSGRARYILDCNATCPTQCACRCSGASCDGRRTCCNQFRYGQCHQEISCYGPVVCRVATCTPPWQYDSSCTATSATDNATVTHGAPCLPDERVSQIQQLYTFFGGAGGALGPVTQAERATNDGSGRYAKYRHGVIFQRNGKGPFAVLSPISSRYSAMGYHGSTLGYPVSQREFVGDDVGEFNRFENGLIYKGPSGAYAVQGSFRLLLGRTGGVDGLLGYPIGSAHKSNDGRAEIQSFERGLMFASFATGAFWTAGAIKDRYVAAGADEGSLKLPTSNVVSVDGGTLQRYENGAIYAKPGPGTHVVNNARVVGVYRDVGEINGQLGWPTSDLAAQGSGVRVLFEKGEIAYRPGTSIGQVHGSIADKWRAKGSYDGVLGWPRTVVSPLPDGTGRFTRFDRGTVYYQRNMGTWEVHGPIVERYRQLGETAGSLGYPRSDVFADGDLSRCNFEHGQLTYDPDTGVVSGP